MNHNMDQKLAFWPSACPDWINNTTSALHHYSVFLFCNPLRHYLPVFPVLLCVMGHLCFLFLHWRLISHWQIFTQMQHNKMHVCCSCTSVWKTQAKPEWVCATTTDKAHVISTQWKEVFDVSNPFSCLMILALLLKHKNQMMRYDIRPGHHSS